MQASHLLLQSFYEEHEDAADQKEQQQHQQPQQHALQQSAAASSGGSSGAAAERAPAGWGGGQLEGSILNSSHVNGGEFAGDATGQPFGDSAAAHALHSNAASNGAALQAPRQWARTGSGSGSSSGQRSAAFTGSSFSGGLDAAPQFGSASGLQPGTASGFQLHGELMPPSLPSDAEHWEQHTQPPPQPPWQAKPSAAPQLAQPADLLPPSGESFAEKHTTTHLILCGTAQQRDRAELCCRGVMSCRQSRERASTLAPRCGLGLCCPGVVARLHWVLLALQECDGGRRRPVRARVATTRRHLAASSAAKWHTSARPLPMALVAARWASPWLCAAAAGW